MISGSGWAWARVRGGGDSLGYTRGRGQSRWGESGRAWVREDERRRRRRGQSGL